MRRIPLIIALALLTLATTLHAAPARPADLRVVWTGADHARLTWTQASDASQVCVEKHNAAGAYTLIGCGPGHAGESFTVLLPPASPHDAALVPHIDDTYALVEFFADHTQMSYAPTTLGQHEVWLPLVQQP